MEKLLAALSDRPITRVVVIYLMVGWIIMQIAEIMVPALNLPDWVNSAMVLLLIILFPVVMLINWGFWSKRSAKAAGDNAQAKSGFKFDYAIYGAATIVLVLIGADFITPDKPSIQRADVPAETAPVEVVGQAPMGLADENHFHGEEKISIAVLPFTDLSANQDQGYFADGIAEELLNALFRLEDLRVAGRTSSFAMKQSAGNLELIGASLNVDHVLTGSIREQDGRFRISVQLVEIADGYVIWSESYNDAVADIFDVQEKIARAVSEELEIVLNVNEGERLVEKATTSPEAYAFFLQGHEASIPRVGDALPRAIAFYEAALEEDPKFARAWAALAEAYMQMPTYADVDLEEHWIKAETNALRSISIDPNLADGHAILGATYMQQRKYVQMQKSLDRALELDPRNVEILHYYGLALLQVGRLREGQTYFERVVELDPKFPYGLNGLAYFHIMQDNVDKGESLARQALMLGFLPANWLLGEAAAVRGEPERAQRLIGPIFKLGVITEFSGEEIDVLIAGSLSNDQIKRDEALSIIDQHLNNGEPLKEGLIPYFLVRLGEPEKAFEVFKEISSPWNEISLGNIWSPYGKEARQQPAFKNFARDIGLVDYWDTYGWVDHCQRISETDFACT
ncbi:MAG: tetratricopeptide repeat protein [Aquisalinus sp.]|nr:tetratricopeptide repeat protein [Aquisalinus sp.]